MHLISKHLLIPILICRSLAAAPQPQSTPKPQSAPQSQPIPQSQPTSPQLFSSSMADTWPAVDALGRKLPLAAQHGVIRKDRYVGLFYFLWHGAEGYDQKMPRRSDEGIQPKLPSDTASPYDITQMLAANPTDPKYGPPLAFHYWSQPAFGYYLSDDEWVIRRHAQMLSDAGVDVIIIDVTNAIIYLPQLTKLLATYTSIRQEGRSTPAVAFMAYTAPAETVRRLYDAIYSKQLFKDLWFYWKGKPLLLTPPEGLSATTRPFFTQRHSWAWSIGEKWFADGKDKWPWLDHSPQNYGWHESKDKAEELSVVAAEHPVSNIGRSFHEGKEPEIPQSERGFYFAEQWNQAIAVDPEFVFVTGWNEWVAMRFIAKNPNKMLGKVVPPGGSYFVDDYNEEYSRDLEPEKGPLKDNYYYQLVDGIRRYKGSRPLPAANKDFNVTIDGKFDDWQNVKPDFSDDAGDTFHRDHMAFGRIPSYINNTGRNDIVKAKVASGKNQISFYVRTAANLTPANGNDWMNLYISGQDTTAAAWEGFQFRITMAPANSGEAVIYRLTTDDRWEKIATTKMAVGEKEIELSLPKQLLGIHHSKFTLEFKWTDNIPADGDPLHWLDTGDTAPNGRFRYRFTR